MSTVTCIEHARNVYQQKLQALDKKILEHSVSGRSAAVPDYPVVTGAQVSVHDAVTQKQQNIQGNSFAKMTNVKCQVATRLIGTGRC